MPLDPDPAAPVLRSADGPQPFLKWVGGKRWLVPTVAPIVLARLAGTYYEPFAGGASVLLALEPESAVLGDINADLVETYATVRDCPDEVLKAIWRLSNTRDCYERVRASRPRSPVTRAARFIYLNRTAWGGVYRLNSRGEFNVPFGASGRTICRKELLFAAARALSNTAVRAGDFANTMAKAGPGDVIFADPPYVWADARYEDGFRRYNFPSYDWNDQLRLIDAARTASERGATVILAAAGQSEVERELADWHFIRLARAQRVSRRVDRRQRVVETLMVSPRP